MLTSVCWHAQNNYQYHYTVKSLYHQVGATNFCTKFWGSSIVFDISLSGSKWWTNWLFCPFMHVAHLVKTQSDLCRLSTVFSPPGSRFWFRPEVVITVEERTVCKQRPVVVVHSLLCRTFLWPSFKAALLQAALWGQTGLLCGKPPSENLQPGGLDPDPVLDDPDQAENLGPAWQNHLKTPWRGCRGVKGNQSDPQTDESVWWEIQFDFRSHKISFL